MASCALRKIKERGRERRRPGRSRGTGWGVEEAAGRGGREKRRRRAAASQPGTGRQHEPRPGGAWGGAVGEALGRMRSRAASCAGCRWSVSSVRMGVATRRLSAASPCFQRAQRRSTMLDADALPDDVATTPARAPVNRPARPVSNTNAATARRSSAQGQTTTPTPSSNGLQHSLLGP